MDFPRHAQWSPWTIEPFDSRKRPSDLKAGDRLKVDMTGMVLKPTVLVRSPLSGSSSMRSCANSSAGELDRPLPVGGVVLRPHQREAYLLLLPEHGESGRDRVRADGGSEGSVGTAAPAVVGLDAEGAG